MPARIRALDSLTLGARTVPASGETGDGMASLHGAWIVDDSVFSTAHLDHYFTTVAPHWLPGVLEVPKVEITTPAQRARYASPAVIHLAATVTEAGSPVQQVAFYEGNNLLGIDTSAPFEGFWRVRKTGPYHVTAHATAANGTTAISEPRLILVRDSPNGGNPTPNFRQGFTLAGPAQIAPANPFRRPGGPGGPGPGGPGPGGPNPGPQNPPEDPEEDFDGDGRVDSEDWVDYDEKLDAWGPTGVPRFAVIETGAFIPWQSNKFGMVLGYKGSQPTVDAEWYVWYQGEREENKLDIESSELGGSNTSGKKMNAIPVLSQDYPVAYGTVGGSRALGCEREDRGVTMGYAFTPDHGFVPLQEAAPSGADEAGMNFTGINANGFVGSVAAIETDGSGEDCEETSRSGTASWSFAGSVAPQWIEVDDDDDDNNGDGNTNNPDDGSSVDEQCLPTKVPEEPPVYGKPAKKQPRQPSHAMIGAVRSITYWKLCQEDKPPGSSGPDPEEYAEAWRQAAETHNAAVDAWTPDGDLPCPEFKPPPGGAGSSGSSEVDVPERGEYLHSGQTQPAVTHPQLPGMDLALRDPIVHQASPPFVAVTKGKWKQGQKKANSKCECYSGTFTRERRILWLTHEGRNDLVELKNGRNGSAIDIGNFVTAGAAGDERTFTVGENGLGGLWADGEVYPWAELTGGKNISLWNWYVGRAGLSCAKVGSGGAILLPVELKEAWSDQIKDVEANGMPDMTGRGAKSYIFMGSRSDGKGHGKLRLGSALPEDVRDKILWRFAKAGTENPEQGSSSYEEAGKVVRMTLDNPPNADEKDFVVVFGHDENEDGNLTQSEVSGTPETMHDPPGGGENPTSMPFTFKVVGQDRYDESRQKNIDMANGLFASLGAPNGAELLKSFCNGVDASIASSVASATIERLEPGLTHPVGIKFTPISNPGNTIRNEFTGDTSLANNLTKSALFRKPFYSNDVKDAFNQRNYSGRKIGRKREKRLVLW